MILPSEGVCALRREPERRRPDLNRCVGFCRPVPQPLGHGAPDRCGVMERMKGFEPSTFCMASRRSSQLSYIRPLHPQPTG
jgi:hypothetical protein